MWILGNWEKVDFGPVKRRAILGLSALVLSALFGAGCASGGRSGEMPFVQSLHLFSVPVAVNLDNQPGPDGFSVRVYAKGTKSSKSVLIPKGTVEVLMFDGLVVDGQSPLPTPLRTWQFAGSELKKHSGRSALGEGYRFTLRWDEARPTKSLISIMARYVPVSGPRVTSAPSSVAIRTK